MHARLTHDFLDQDVIKLVRFNWLTFIIKLVIEDVKCESTSLGKLLIDQERVLLICMGEMNNLIAFIIDMRLVIISFLNGLLWAYELANVDCRRICELFEVIRQILQIITKIMSLSDVLLEFILFILDFLLLSLLLNALHSLGSILLGKVIFCLHDADFLFFANTCRSLHLRVIKEPLG